MIYQKKFKLKTLKKLLNNFNLEKGDIIVNCAGVIKKSSKQRKLYNKLYLKNNK